MASLLISTDNIGLPEVGSYAVCRPGRFTKRVLGCVGMVTGCTFDLVLLATLGKNSASSYVIFNISIVGYFTIIYRLTFTKIISRL